MDALLWTVEAHKSVLTGKLKIVEVLFTIGSEPFEFTVEEINKGLSSVENQLVGCAYFIRFMMPLLDLDTLDYARLNEEAQKNGLDPIELRELCEDAWIRSFLTILGYNVHFGKNVNTPQLSVTRPGMMDA